MSIEQARAAFDRADPPTGLAHLLEAWRTLRLPRIADLIQHVSDALVAAAPPIEGATELAYVEAFEALAPGDPVDLQSESVDGLFIQAGIDARTGKVTGAAISRVWT